MNRSEQEHWMADWETLQARQRAEQAQAAEALAAPAVAALRVALGPSRSPQARRRRPIRADLAGLNAEASAFEARQALRAAGRGRRPDGRPVSTAAKRAAFERYERLQASHHGQVPPAERSSALPIVAAIEGRELGVPAGQVCRYW